VVFETLDPSYWRTLQEALLTLTNTLQNITRTGFDDGSRIRSRVEWLDDGWIRVRVDTGSALDISLTDLLREFSRTFYNIVELNSLVLSLLNEIIVISKISLFNTSITANTNIFSVDLSPTRSPCIFRIYVCFNASGVLSVVRTKGGVSVIEQLNSGLALTANAAYVFDILVDADESINLQYSVDATALKISVVEVKVN